MPYFASTPYALAMEVAIAYFIRDWFTGTPYEWVYVLAVLLVIVQLIYYVFFVPKRIDPEEQVLRRISHGVAVIVLAATWYKNAPDENLNYVYAAGAAIGLYMFISGMQVGWGWPFRFNYTVRSMIKIAIGIYAMQWELQHRSFHVTTEQGFMYLGIEMAGVFCVSTGITRLILTSGSTRAVLIWWQRRRLEAAIRKHGGVHGDASVPRE